MPYISAVTAAMGSSVRTNRQRDSVQSRVVATRLSTSSMAAMATMPHTIAMTLCGIVTASTPVIKTRLTTSNRTTTRPSLRVLSTL